LGWCVSTISDIARSRIDEPRDCGLGNLRRPDWRVDARNYAGTDSACLKVFFTIFVDAIFTTLFERLFTNVFDVTGARDANDCVCRPCNVD
jgi:hypothetical protein